jgi:hypothetical protein
VFLPLRGFFFEAVDAIPTELSQPALHLIVSVTCHQFSLPIHHLALKGTSFSSFSSPVMNYIQVRRFLSPFHHANSEHFYSLRSSARPHSSRHLPLADFFILHRRGDVRHSVQSMLIPTLSSLTSHPVLGPFQDNQ